MRAPPITLSESAARRINALSAGEGRPVKLRVAVDGGGCSGFQYRLDLVEAGEPSDLVVERDGAAALVDDVSQPLLAGSGDRLGGRARRLRVPRPQPQRTDELRLRGELLDLSRTRGAAGRRAQSPLT